jgi:phosphoribosylformylglycinamidine cyclo-ligase
MPGIYTEGSYDIVGTMIGTVDKSEIIDGYTINSNSKVYGLRSVSPHTNGYSSIRKCYSENADFNFFCKNNMNFANWITAPHKCYFSELSELGLKNIQGLCHITGGGYIDNLKRVLPNEIGLKLNKSAIFTSEFRTLQEYLKISDEDMLSTFNCGIGMVVFVDSSVAENIPDNFIEIGEVFNNTDETSITYY